MDYYSINTLNKDSDRYIWYQSSSILGLLNNEESFTPLSITVNRKQGEGSNSHNILTPFPIRECPKFDGENPRKWIESCDRYFGYLSTFPEEFKVPLTGIYMEGRAAQWYRECIEDREVPSWHEFTKGVIDKFEHEETNPEISERNNKPQLVDGVLVEKLIEEIQVASKVFEKLPVKEFKETKERKMGAEVFDKMFVKEVNELRMIGIDKFNANEENTKCWNHTLGKTSFIYNCGSVEMIFIIDPGGNIVKQTISIDSPFIRHDPRDNSYHHEMEGLGINSLWRKYVGVSKLPLYNPDDKTFPYSDNLEEDFKSIRILNFEKYSWYTPVTMKELQNLLKSNKVENGTKIKLVVGNTSDVYYEETDKYDRYIDLTYIPELSVVKEDNLVIEFGAALSISKLIIYLKEKSERGVMLARIANHMEKFACGFIRKSASISGNLMMAQRKHFPSGIATLFLDADCSVSILTGHKREKITIDEFLNRPPFDPKDVLLSVYFPSLETTQIDASFESNSKLLFETYRTAQRPLLNAVPYLNAAFFADTCCNENGVLVKSVRLAFGAFGTKHATRAGKVEEFLKGKILSVGVLDEVVRLVKGVVLSEDGTSYAAYRTSLAVGLLFEFLNSFSVVGSSENLYASLLEGAAKSDNDRNISQIGKNGPLLSSAKQIVESSKDYYLVGEPMPKFERAPAIDPKEPPQNNPQMLLKELAERKKFVSPERKAPPKRFILKPPLDDAKLAEIFLNSPQLSLKSFPLLSSCLPSTRLNNANKTWIDEYLLEVKRAFGYPLEPSENYGDDNPAKQFDTLLNLAFQDPHCERTNTWHVRSGHSRLSFLGQYILEMALCGFFLQRYPRESSGLMKERVYALIGKRFLPRWIKAASLQNMVFPYDDMDKLVRKDREPHVKSVIWALFGAIYLCFGMREVYRVLFDVFGMDPGIDHMMANIILDEVGFCWKKINAKMLLFLFFMEQLKWILSYVILKFAKTEDGMVQIFQLQRLCLRVKRKRSAYNAIRDMMLLGIIFAIVEAKFLNLDPLGQGSQIEERNVMTRNYGKGYFRDLKKTNSGTFERVKSVVKLVKVVN